MKYSLSEGDKNALALAFFLAKLEADENLQNKIIVFDDTVSNFDRNRLSKLLNQLITFGQKARQLFFLTHNLRLGQEFIKRLEKEQLPITQSQLQFFGATMNLVKFP
ncbi:MAG: AAA family ATPase [Saprospiraceae bacterium]